MTTTTATNQGSVPLIIEGPAYLSQFQNQFPVTEIPKEFPVRTLKVLGSVQIGLGVVLGILSIVGIVLDVIGMNRDFEMRYYGYWMCPRQDQYRHNLLAFDITCLVLSGWYLLTGILPLCMSRKRESSWGRLRIGFMVCSIIGASIFVPTMFSLGIIGGLMRAIYDQGRVTVLSAFMAVLSFAEFVVSIIGASFCCCCTPWKRTEQTIRVILYCTARAGKAPSTIWNSDDSRPTKPALHSRTVWKPSYSTEPKGHSSIWSWPIVTRNAFDSICEHESSRCK